MWDLYSRGIDRQQTSQCNYWLVLLYNKPSPDLEQLFIFSSYNCRPADLGGALLGLLKRLWVHGGAHLSSSDQWANLWMCLWRHSLAEALARARWNAQGLLGPWLITGFVWPNPKSRCKGYRYKLEWIIETVMQVTMYSIRSSNIKDFEEDKTGSWLKSNQGSFLVARYCEMVYCHHHGYF